VTHGARARAWGLASERSGPKAVAHGQALVAHPARSEQKMTTAGSSWRRRLGAEGGGGGKERLGARTKE
jgi:hypothetical protein